MLSDFFGDSALIKVIDFLEMNQEFDYTKAEIARNVGISKVTLYQLWPTLEKTGLVVETRRIGNGKLYKYNKNNPLAKALEMLSNAIDLAYFKREKAKQKHLMKLKI